MSDVLPATPAEMTAALKRAGSLLALSRQLRIHRATLRKQLLRAGVDPTLVNPSPRVGRNARAAATSWSGTPVHFVDPDPESIRIDDVAHHLAHICRFTGATDVFYSVAQHSVCVAIRVLLRSGDRRRALVGLLHDAPEAWTGDLSTPFKQVVGPAYRHITKRLNDAVMRAFCIEPEEWDRAMMPLGDVAEADRHYLHQEALRFRCDGWAMDAATGEKIPALRRWVPDHVILEDDPMMDPWEPARARREFLETYVKLAR